jgi:hypothetical protein
MQLCALADVKTLLDIPDTSRDAKLTIMINGVSKSIARFLGYDPSWEVVVSEAHTINNRQLVYLDKQPIQSVSTVTLMGLAIVAGTGDGDYQLSPIDAKLGRLYRGNGWCGTYYVRDMTYDPVAGTRSILVSYTGGWHLVDDIAYVAGAAISLPYDIVDAAQKEVVRRYRHNALGLEGIETVKEGGASYSLNKKTDNSLDWTGLSVDCQSDIVSSGYKRWGVG